jgi:hypothetical protein
MCAQYATPEPVGLSSKPLSTWKMNQTNKYVNAGMATKKGRRKYKGTIETMREYGKSTK